ncbi:MAG: dihydroorotate dehydrogenase electron transfer subunit [Porphyromonadaceae bacterium]|nr:dihydroorotate dehydrogenase electron transfer subunit [Porphyromonadaceae bacterium]
MTAKKQIALLQLSENLELGRGNHLLKLRMLDGGALPSMSAGQFVEVQAPGGHVLLRRPISVCNVDEATGELWLLVARVGRGTHAIAEAKVGDSLSLVFPLGNCFSVEGAKRPLLVGGGVGTAPMLYLAKTFARGGIRPDILLGGRTADQLVLLDEFRRYGTLHLTTDDGTMGVHGRVTDHPLWREGAYDRIYTCGPKPMMVVVARLAAERGIDCEVSLENTMACGIGACLCCVEDVHERGNVCVCTEGPVFNSKELKW